jgi:hypothetical protein
MCLVGRNQSNRSMADTGVDNLDLGNNHKRTMNFIPSFRYVLVPATISQLRSKSER